MCRKRNCPCRWTDRVITELFVGVFERVFTPEEEAYIDTEPDIAGPMRELDRRAREEKNRRRGF